jgi:hypothetical protein
MAAPQHQLGYAPVAKKARLQRRVCARVALYNGEYPKAEQELQQAIGLQATSLPAWEALAMVQQASGDLSESAKTYERLVSPALHHAWRRLAAPHPIHPAGLENGSPSLHPLVSAVRTPIMGL